MSLKIIGLQLQRAYYSYLFRFIFYLCLMLIFYQLINNLKIQFSANVWQQNIENIENIENNGNIENIENNDDNDVTAVFYHIYFGQSQDKSEQIINEQMNQKQMFIKILSFMYVFRDSCEPTRQCYCVSILCRNHFYLLT